MITLIVSVHVIVCFFLIFVVLIQRGKGADMGAVFGGSTNTILGASGAVSLLQKVTTGAAILFMATSLYLAWSSAKRESVLEKAKTLGVQPKAVAKEKAAESRAAEKGKSRKSVKRRIKKTSKAKEGAKAKPTRK